MSNQIPAVPSDPYQEMERADEQMVLDEIKGRAIESLVYEITQNGQTITELSLAGVRETARVMNSKGNARIGISEREPLITETDDYFEVKVYAQDAQNGGGYWGIKRQPKSTHRRDGGKTANPFALEQALAKAQRNAMRGLIPEWFVKQMIDAWRTAGKGQKLGAIEAPKQAAPVAAEKQEPPATDLPLEKMCPIHDAIMTRRFSDKQQKYYYSHKSDDGAWCYGKPPQDKAA